MEFDANNEIEIERGHRQGRKCDDGKPRLMEVKFVRYQDKEFIRNSAYLLKESQKINQRQPIHIWNEEPVV